jgi:hypothetical protein
MSQWFHQTNCGTVTGSNCTLHLQYFRVHSCTRTAGSCPDSTVRRGDHDDTNLVSFKPAQDCDIVERGICNISLPLIPSYARVSQYYRK